MPIVAAPNYLGRTFRDASPGLRFGMYLELWGVDRQGGDTRPIWKTHDVSYRPSGHQRTIRRFEDESKTHALKSAAHLTSDDCKLVTALVARQAALAQACADGANNVFSVRAIAVSPLVTGLGNEHPLENGFAFLNPYGLPYLPASGVKGVIRRAAEELASGQWGETQGWSKEPCGENGRTMIDVLCGVETPSGSQNHARGALSFWDVTPQPREERLDVEIMTPHQAHYYQEGESPHDSGNPNPIAFLAVPSGSAFTFHVVCDLTRLQRHAPDLAESARWKTLLAAAFNHAFDWLGFGAKTSVGYGAMRIDPRVEAEAAKQAKREAERLAEEEEERRRIEAERAEAERVAAEQAEFDALPESRKTLMDAEKAFGAFQEGGQFDDSRRNAANEKAKHLVEAAPNWTDESHREEAAVLLERYYDRAGWYLRGAGKKRRIRQERRKRDAIARIRGGA